MNDQDRQRNAAWQAAHQWKERARQARPRQGMSGPRLVLTWLMFGVLMIVGTILGLFFLLVGWAMLPFLRHRMKKRMEQMRAQQAEDIGGSYYQHGSQSRSSGGHLEEHEVLEGEYREKK
ncbi:hypothetical protein SAMN05216571_107111 [Onishia taeanensis]|jgi:hypothetical protein|uniref:Uncharacterized protein n=1 Tax=Onishia taeanensis TaxID=284577 RepID=A0A1G7SRS1_9GAMM|nr:hypothetical protein [Halomonas taeanensis]MAX32963.1 hypothetical protein [Halomonadaceae bacterium]SDG25733.1 hypothetical protein SAMN05216571_107111 [Halomonas taeanensis]